MALARRVSTLSATRWLGDAWAVARDTPATFAALAAGQLSWWAARSIATETAGLDRDTRLAVEAAVAAEAADLLPGQAAGLARRRVLAVDPGASAARAERARAERWVRIEEDESPAMALLTARLPAEAAAAAWSALHDHARAAWAHGAPGTVSTLMADTLVQRLTGLARADEVPICVDLVMTDAALLGGTDTPAELTGFGPVPAAVARRLAVGSARWLRRLYADPADGVLTGADPRRRLFGGAARQLVGLLDPHCRGPQCPAPVAEVDHVVACADGGPTVVGNGQGLSKGCHRLRDHPGVAVTAAEHSHVLAWRLPSGAVCRTIPAPVLGHGSLSAAQVAHRHRLTHPDDQRPAGGKTATAFPPADPRLAGSAASSTGGRADTELAGPAP